MTKTTIPTGGITADAVNATLIADDAINSEHYTDGSIDTAHVADSQITTAKIGTLTQIVFNATQSASANANTLDDYEEGTWTPSWSAGGGSLTGTSSNYGKYTKTGDTVKLWFGAVIDSGTASSYYRITNAPFTAATNGSGTAINGETANIQKAWWDSGGTTVNINRYDGTVESDPNLKVHITMKV